MRRFQKYFFQLSDFRGCVSSLSKSCFMPKRHNAPHLCFIAMAFTVIQFRKFITVAITDFRVNLDQDLVQIIQELWREPMMEFVRRTGKVATENSGQSMSLSVIPLIKNKCRGFANFVECNFDEYSITKNF